jgi:uncharacterized UBP type Zn finger protein
VETFVQRKHKEFRIQELLDAVQKKFPQFDGFKQQDAHEFFISLCDLLDSTLDSKLSLLFRLCIENRITCLNCSYKREVLEDHLNLSLDLQALKTMTERLQTYFEPVIAALKCEKCQSDLAEIHPVIRELPNVLVVHLKRFRQEDSLSMTKVKTWMEINESIDLSCFLCDTQKTSSTFSLAAVIQHLGDFASSGHYVSDVFDEKEGSWIRCNDAFLSKVNLRGSFE